MYLDFLPQGNVKHFPRVPSRRVFNAFFKGPAGQAAASLQGRTSFPLTRFSAMALPRFTLKALSFRKFLKQVIRVSLFFIRIVQIDEGGGEIACNDLKIKFFSLPHRFLKMEGKWRG